MTEDLLVLLEPAIHDAPLEDDVLSELRCIERRPADVLDRLARDLRVEPAAIAFWAGVAEEAGRHIHERNRVIRRVPTLPHEHRREGVDDRHAVEFGADTAIAGFPPIHMRSLLGASMTESLICDAAGRGR